MAAPDARTLATLLATLDDAALTELLAARRVPPTAGWSDYFDAADALLEVPSLLRGVAGLARPEADALRDAVRTGEKVPPGPVRDGLVKRALVGPDGRVYRAVVAAWDAVPDAVTPGTAVADPPESYVQGTSASAAGAESEAHAAERAFAASTSLADVLQSTLATPLSRIGSGAIGATDRRRLIDQGAVDTPDAADELVAIAALGGLVAEADRQWLVTRSGERWLGLRTVERWHEVSRRLRDALPASLRTADDGWIPVEEWPRAHPFDPSWPGRAAHLRALFARWALIGPHGGSPSWAAGLAAGGDADESALQALLPAEVDRVFLQNDLTAISPGPLDPQLDIRLRSMTLRESRAQASTYRFTSETLNNALTAGETADSLRTFLTSLSLTGLPQPLEYEIERSARRHGSVQIGPDWAGNTRVTASDAALLQSIEVDQALRPLGLVADGDALITRSAADTTFWMLADARYPVVAVDADGKRRSLDRNRLAPDAASAEAPDDYRPLRERLRAAHETDADSAWLGRELEQAVRARAVITIVVRLPDGSEREVTLEATGLGGGRLRGKDRVADVERTLPVSSIASVRPA